MTVIFSSAVSNLSPTNPYPILSASPSESFHMIFLLSKKIFFSAFCPLRSDISFKAFLNQMFWMNVSQINSGQVHSLCISVTLNGFNHVYVIAYLHIYLSISMYVSIYHLSIIYLYIWYISYIISSLEINTGVCVSRLEY